jgi:hypothetical protein
MLEKLFKIKMARHAKIIRVYAQVPRMELLPLYWLCQKMQNFITGCLLTLRYPAGSNPLTIYKMCSYILRSVPRRPSYKISASGSKNYITVTTQQNQERILSEDYGTPTGNTNSSSDADFLADMFDRTPQVYHHHLRYVCDIQVTSQTL